MALLAWWVLVSEIYPARVRDTALGIAVATLWLVAKFARRHVGMYQEAGITISLATRTIVLSR